MLQLAQVSQSVPVWVWVLALVSVSVKVWALAPAWSRFRQKLQAYTFLNDLRHKRQHVTCRSLQEDPPS